MQSVSENDLRKALEGNQISWAVALAIQKSYPDCNPTWIVTGEEEMLLEDVPQTINDRIKEIRISMGLSAAEMAKKLDKPRSTYSQIENGQMKVTLETVLAIYEMTSLPLEYILLGECREQVAKLMKLNREKAELIKKIEAMRKEINKEEAD